jgi:hypothetical protein
VGIVIVLNHVCERQLDPHPHLTIGWVLQNVAQQDVRVKKLLDLLWYWAFEKKLYGET